MCGCRSRPGSPSALSREITKTSPSIMPVSTLVSQRSKVSQPLSMLFSKTKPENSVMVRCPLHAVV